jgi:glutamate synthase domain-containing protein 1
MSDSGAIFKSREELCSGVSIPQEKTCEGGCGVIGIIGTEGLNGRYIIRSCEQLENRGNAKGGGIAAVGLFPEEYKDHYALHIGYLDEQVVGAVEKAFVDSVFDVAHAEWQPNIEQHQDLGLVIKPPRVKRYFVQPKSKVVEQFKERFGFDNEEEAKDEFVFQNSFRLNYQFYANAKEPQAFVLSHGKDLMILKAVGYANQIAKYYQLEDTAANVWIGHQRYPTRGRVWHPGGAHPFAGLHEALVHNGDFANYHSVTEYLRQRGMIPLFVTDTEVSVLLFDLYSRVLHYPMEYVIEALAPTPEGDFERLSKRRQRIYRALQTAHMHGSPDGPWFFIIARNDPETKQPQLIGITDVSMLRPQVFAVQHGQTKSVAAIGSEKQAIDAFFEDVSQREEDVLPVADRYWNARGGSCTDGGAFVFSLEGENGNKSLSVRDKFNNPVVIESAQAAADRSLSYSALGKAFEADPNRLESEVDEKSLSQSIVKEKGVSQAVLGQHEAGYREERRAWGELCGETALKSLAQNLIDHLRTGDDDSFTQAIFNGRTTVGVFGLIRVLTHLRDRHWNSGVLRRAKVLSLIDSEINSLLDALGSDGSRDSSGLLRIDVSSTIEDILKLEPQHYFALVVDARGFPPEGNQAVCRVLVAAYEKGWKRFIVYRCQGDRFIGCGFGPKSDGVRIDVYGSSGDYLGSGIDGAEIYVHGNGQDQIGQIMKSGRIVIHGDVGQTLLYGAKGGEVFIRGNAAGRPLINAVGKIRGVINGTCLDYCAESFMAGRDTGDGFIIINGLHFDYQGVPIGLETKYPGNNLFSLASGGCCYLNDPYRTVKRSQLNGGEFVPFRQQDWNIVVDYLRTNETLFGLSIRNDLLLVDGVLRWPKEVFRKVVASHETTQLDWSSLDF